MLVGLLSVWVIITVKLPPRLITLNVSPSIAPGFYIAVRASPAVGSFVEFPLPQAFRDTLPGCAVCARQDALILKPIAAGPGDRVDTTGARLVINGVPLAPIRTQDSQGHPVPVWRANRVLGEDEYFAFSARVPNSLDSRYFGPIQRSDIVALRAPLVTW
ncbi:MAG: S26 family signal peptidase [Phycisphaerae bacterium]|jgi:conjugative transfer signal peptidase TraF